MALPDPEPIRVYIDERGHTVYDYGELKFPAPSWLAEWLDTPRRFLDRLRFAGFDLGRDERGGVCLVNQAGEVYPLNADTLPGDPEHIRAKLRALLPKWWPWPTVEEVRSRLSATEEVTPAPAPDAPPLPAWPRPQGSAT